MLFQNLHPYPNFLKKFDCTVGKNNLNLERINLED